MPLIDLKTNLKDLKYDKDQKGGGWSGLPFIRFPFPENADSKMRDFYTLNQTNIDFPSRGGIAATDQVGLPLSYRSELDRKLIEKYLTSTPRGQMFIEKQVGLQLSNPKMQTAQTVPSFKISEIPGVIENTRIFNRGRNMLTQIQVAGTGAHLNRAGILPANPIEKFYKDTVGLESLMTVEEVSGTNRLLILQQMKLMKGGEGPGLPGSPTKGPGIANNLGIPLYKDILFEYLGGPGSAYGIGSTTIKRYDHTDRAIDVQDGSKSKPMSSLAMSYDKLMQQNRATMNGKSITNYRDYRLEIGPKNNIESQKDLWGYDSKLKLENRFFVESETNPGRVDKLNSLFHIFTQGQEDIYNTTGEQYDDLIKFIFECKSNDNTQQSVFLFFRAFLGQITDNNQASYNNFRYMGRGENFYVYQGFERSISFGFKIAIGSGAELAGAYERLNYLISQTYPDYAPSTKYMRGNLIKLTIGDYITKMPGFLESVNVTISNETPWEIDEGEQLPQSLDVNITFRPIFEDLPQRSMGEKTAMPIIARSIIRGHNLSIDQTKETNDRVESSKLLQEQFKKDVSKFVQNLSPRTRAQNIVQSAFGSNASSIAQQNQSIGEQFGGLQQFPITGPNGETIGYTTANSSNDPNATVSLEKPGQIPGGP